MEIGNRPANVFIYFSVIFVLCIIIFLQFINPCLYECDGYYHIKVPHFIKESGLRYNFPWAQFSTFKKCFSDKELLFHILILPFTFIGKDIHLQARGSIIFFALSLILAFVFVQRKYVLKSILILSVLSLSLSQLFLIYINYLRPKTMAISIILILIYFLAEKKWIPVFIMSIIYSLTHVSFLFAVVLSVGIEILRYLYNREFYIKNILFSILGIILGILIHPNYPNNLVSINLNAILVPWNTMFGNLKLNYGLEWNPANTQGVILDLLVFFLGVFFAVVFLITKRPKIEFHSIAFFFAASFFFFLSMFSNCYWYFTYPIGIIFLSMFFSDYLKDKSTLIKNIFICAIGAVLIIKAFIINYKDNISTQFVGQIDKNLHYERIANWMNEHIPPKEIIFHSSWSDSPYFICLNPKDYYLNMLDPIYMYFYSKDIYNIYDNLSNGYCIKPCKVLKKIFKVNYGYTGKGYGLYKQIKDRGNIRILFEDDYGAIFKIIKQDEIKNP